MDAVYALRAARRPLCLFGHTHVPVAARLRGETLAFLDAAPGEPLTHRDGERVPGQLGSVGQPRDGDPRAGYGVLDDGGPEVTCYRVAYPVERAQARIRDGRPARGAGAGASASGADTPAGAQAGGACAWPPSLPPVPRLLPGGAVRRRSVPAARDPRIQPITTPIRIIAGM